MALVEQSSLIHPRQEREIKPADFCMKPHQTLHPHGELSLSEATGVVCLSRDQRDCHPSKP
jgi:hypothetical protein